MNISTPPIVVGNSYFLQAKIEKRSRRDLYEGSKLLDAHRKQA